MTAPLARTATVRDPDGLHARPCALVARAARRFRCSVRVSWDGKTADATSVLELLRLSAPGGAEVLVEAEGPDAAKCADAVAAAVEA